MISLGSKTWGSSPAIGMSFAYEKQRSGADMQYRAKVTVNTVTGAAYFGYPIYLKLSIGGTLRVTTTLKAASPSQWSSAITYTSNWYTVENKTSGTTSVSFNIYSGSGSSRNSTYSYSMAIDPAASVLDVSNGTLGVAQTLNVTRYGDSFTHTITYVCGNDEGTICTKSSDTSVSWTPPIALAKNAPNGTAATIALTTTTYDGDTTIGTSTKTIMAAIPSSVVPTVSLNVVDAAGYLSTYSGYVQNKSTPKVTITAAGAQGSSIRSYATTIDGDTYTAAEFTAPALKGSGTLTVKTTVTDSRGRTATASKSITVLSYNAPKISALSVQRVDENGVATSSGSRLKVTFSATVEPLNSKNGASYTLKYKKTAESAYTSVSLNNYAGVYSVSGGVHTFAVDTGSYDVVIVATDDFSSATRGAAGSSVSKFFSWLHGGLGWAFGKVSEKSKTVELSDGWNLEVGGKIYDAFGTLIGGGLAAYSGGGDAGIDPDTTLEELCLTSHANAPQGLGTFYYIHTAFYNTKSATAARAQVAFPYNKSGSMYHRYYASGAWSSWQRYMAADEVFPVNSVVIMYTHDSPAAIYGGTWHRMQSRFLWGTTTEGTIGATGGEQTHTLTTDEMPSHRHSFNGVPVTKDTSGYEAARSATFSQQATGLGYTSYVGGGAAHNNMPPYVNVAIWRRIE